MPIHDWTRVEAGIFHHFYHAWIYAIQRVLNSGVLPPEFYALAEQVAGGVVPDVLTLSGPASESTPEEDSGGGVVLATAVPKTRYQFTAGPDPYITRAKSVVVRHRSGHNVVAMIEILSPGNKGSQHALRSFVEKAAEMLRAGIHLLLIDLLPPGPRDPQGIHKAVWDEVIDEPFELPADKPLTLAAYMAGLVPEAFVEPVAVGDDLPEMPLFLQTGRYIPLPLQPTYQSAWEAVPDVWREVVAGEVAG